jgi:hypothetical protein
VTAKRLIEVGDRERLVVDEVAVDADLSKVEPAVEGRSHGCCLAG